MEQCTPQILDVSVGSEGVGAVARSSPMEAPAPAWILLAAQHGESLWPLALLVMNRRSVFLESHGLKSLSSSIVGNVDLKAC